MMCTITCSLSGEKELNQRLNGKYQQESSQGPCQVPTTIIAPAVKGNAAFKDTIMIKGPAVGWLTLCSDDR